MLCKNGVEGMQEWRGSNARMAWKQRKNGVETMPLMHRKMLKNLQNPLICSIFAPTYKG